MNIYRVKFNEYTICIVCASSMQDASRRFADRFPGINMEDIYIYEIEFDVNGIEVPHQKY